MFFNDLAFLILIVLFNRAECMIFDSDLEFGLRKEVTLLIVGQVERGVEEAELIETFRLDYFRRGLLPASDLILTCGSKGIVPILPWVGLRLR